MALRAGERLGPYEVVELLAAGGMGEVYRARDTRLGREVAVKVLPAERMADPSRRARFEREARAVAALNHPNIVTLHGIESADGVDFMVMELVAGQTLQTLIARGAMGHGDALKIAIPLADALATAHAAGIVHRDVKPANVMVTPNGVVKVLDFGLAKLTQPDEASVGEATTQGVSVSSQPGVALGTAGYMSPEQVAGEPADVRSDVFSLGVVLYEMVTGRRAFAGSSSAETLAAVLRDEPKAPSAIVPGLPKELERIIQRCLRKEPGRRFQSMHDVKIELEELAEDAASQAAGATAAPAGRKRRRVMAVVAIGAIVLSTAAAAALWCLRRREPPAPQVVLLASSRSTGYGSFSPDGSLVAFDSPGEKFDNWDIWVKFVGEAETRRLTTDPAADCCPAWSADGKQIAFVRMMPGATAGAVYLVSPLGGPERKLSEYPASMDQLSWSPDNRWLAVTSPGGRWLAATRVQAEREATPESSGIHLISARDGEVRILTRPQPPTRDQKPAFAPDGRALAYASCENFEMPACDLNVLALDSELRPQGAPRRVSSVRFWSNGVAWSRDGRSVVYGAYNDRLWRVRADGSSPPARVEVAGRGAGAPFSVKSLDRLGFIQENGDIDIYRFRAGIAGATPVMASTAAEFFPQYSPDGRRIAYQSQGDTESVFLADAEGSNPVRLTRGPGHVQGSARWSPDGRTLSFDAQAADGHFDVWTIGVDGSALRQVTRRTTDHGPSSWSRDGRWIYFHSTRTGRREVWRIAVTGDREEQVTHHGGYLPLESPDGRTLYFQRDVGESPLLAMPTAGGEERTVIRCVPHWGYAVGPRGVFHLDCNPPGALISTRRALRHWEVRTGQDQLLATLDTGPFEPFGLSASPDGQEVLFTRGVLSRDLMMIENFR